MTLTPKRILLGQVWTPGGRGGGEGMGGGKEGMGGGGKKGEGGGEGVHPCMGYNVPLNRVWFSVVFASLSLEQESAFLSGTGSTFCHSDSGALSGLLFAARIALQTNVVAVSTRVPLHVYSNTPFRIRRSTASHFFQSETGYLFSRFCLERGCKNCVSLIWNRVRFPGTQRHTPILNWKEWPPDTPTRNLYYEFRRLRPFTTCSPIFVRENCHSALRRGPDENASRPPEKSAVPAGDRVERSKWIQHPRVTGFIWIVHNIYKIFKVGRAVIRHIMFTFLALGWMALRHDIGFRFL